MELVSTPFSVPYVANSHYRCIDDPWREATVAADGVASAGSDVQPRLLGDGFHCSDLLIREGAVSTKIKGVQDQAVQYMAQWIGEWTPGSA